MNDVEQLVRRHLEAWSLYRPEHDIRTKQFNRDMLSIMYSTGPRGWTKLEVTSASINRIHDVFYILFISIAPSARGHGHGSRLYEILIDIATDLGCREIRQTPSGWTPSGETRRSYLNRRGWIDDGCEVIRRLSGEVV